jgi:hypothetical protein
LELGDDGQSIRIGGFDHVALVDQPQSDASADRCDNFAVGDLQFSVGDRVRVLYSGSRTRVAY